MPQMKVRYPRPELLVLAAVVFGGCLGPRGISDELVDVTGEFRADGTCDAQTPKGSLAPRDVEGQTNYTIGRSLNVAHTGFTLHAIACQFPGHGNRILALNRGITIMIGVRGLQPLHPGRYAVWPLGVQDTTGTQASLSVTHPAYDVGTAGSGRGGAGGSISLRGASGWLEIMRADSDHVVARFAIRGRREWSM
jgi:hypothetical protein